MHSTARHQIEMRRTRSIRWPLIAAIVAAFLTPAIISSGLVAVMGFDATRLQMANQLESVVSSKTAQIDLWMEDVQHNLAAVAADDGVRGWIRRVLPDTRSAALSMDAGFHLKDKFLTFIGQTQSFDSLFVLDLNGNLAHSSDFDVTQLNALLGANVLDPEYEKPFEGQLDIEQAAENVVILPAEYDPVTGLSVTIIQPVTNSAGQTVALLGGHVNTQRLEVIAGERAGLGETGETLLLDRNHHLLTPSLFPDMYPVGDTSIDIESFVSPSDGEDAPIHQYSNYRGENVLGVYQSLPTLGMTMVAEITEAEALGWIVNTLTAISLLGAAAVIATGLAGVWFINRRIISPINRLTRSAAQITDGALDVRMEIRSNDEFGLLADTFNAMTDRLSQMADTERLAKTRLETIVSDYVAFVQRVAEGDLTSQLDLNTLDIAMMEGTSQDLVILGGNLNQMVENLRTMAQQIHTASENIVLAASDIQIATMLQANSATEQNAAVSQTVATVEEVRHTVEQTAERARQVASTSQQSVQVSRTGQQAVTENANGMAIIRQRVESIAESILALSDRTQQIGEIIDTVNALADQSKLLALNASIEAARAGEEGKGFAVVAMEVRQLAEQSREATARVRDIIDEIRDTTNSAVMVTEQGSKGAAEGMELVERTGSAIRELAATIEEAAQAATQIATSTFQQTDGMNQLAAAMSQIKSASEQTTHSTHQTEESVQNLMTMAEQLEKAAARYQL